MDYMFDTKFSGNLYQFIFLCGSKYLKNNKSDKRNVLRQHLINISSDYRPIILEDNFIFATNSKKELRYGDIYMKSLYDVEFLVSLLSDKILIFHESISTGAESGLFLGEATNRNKTCLLLPNIESVEEDKMGSFLKLSFFSKHLGDNAVKQITYYPKITNHIVSKNLRNLHTSFIDDEIGEVLSKQIVDFIGSESKTIKIERIKINDKENTLELKLSEESIFLCIASMMSLEDVRNDIFNKDFTMKEIIDKLIEKINKILKNTVEEIKPYKFSKDPKITFKLGKEITLKKAVGMSLYLMSAAELISIQKVDNYKDTRKVKLSLKKIESNFFYKKYEGFIKEVVGDQIIK